MLIELGPETVDLIIDHLHDDKLSLQACSMTCKRWLPSSRYHLFSEIYLSPFNVNKFRQLLETTPCSIASIVRRLTLSEFNGYICWHDGIDITAANEDLRSVSACLRAVTFLRVVHSEGLDPDILSGWNSVRELEMVNLSVSSMDDVFRLVHDIPELQTLSMENVNWDSGGRDPSRRSSFALRTMKLEGNAFADVTNWLLGSNPSPTVHTLHCDAYDPATSKSRDSLLQLVGHSITSLHLHLNNRPIGLDGTFHPICFILY
jgi:hypothetical protein